jgi:hypothetical protein
MLTLEEVKTAHEADAFYAHVVRNFDFGLRRWVEADPQELPGDSDKIRVAKAAYRKLRSLSPGHPHRRTTMHS